CRSNSKFRSSMQMHADAGRGSLTNHEPRPRVKVQVTDLDAVSVRIWNAGAVLPYGSGSKLGF
uniref:Uncharacterized protein n=1 Tax=Cannabis sativa TaxID=3483 RepID=A0A803QSD4_CANSA